MSDEEKKPGRAVVSGKDRFPQKEKPPAMNPVVVSSDAGKFSRQLFGKSAANREAEIERHLADRDRSRLDRVNTHNEFTRAIERAAFIDDEMEAEHSEILSRKYEADERAQKAEAAANAVRSTVQITIEAQLDGAQEKAETDRAFREIRRRRVHGLLEAIKDLEEEIKGAATAKERLRLRMQINSLTKEAMGVELELSALHTATNKTPGQQPRPARRGENFVERLTELLVIQGRSDHWEPHERTFANVYTKLELEEVPKELTPPETLAEWLAFMRRKQPTLTWLLPDDADAFERVIKMLQALDDD